jgi:hypothetical protein
MSKYLGDVIYDMETAKLALKGMSDADLFDACMYDIQANNRDDLDKLYDKLVDKQKLTPEERKSLETFYILANADFLVEE